MTQHKPWKEHPHPPLPGYRHKHRYLRGRFFGFLFFLAVPLIIVGILALFFFERSGWHMPGPQYGRMLLCGLPLVLPILTFWLGALFFRRMGTPLANIMAATDALAEGDFSTRIPEGAPGEFGRMVRSFNRMAEELEIAEQQRLNLTADVAHELRTPLHILQGNLEGLLDSIYEPTPEHIEAMLDETRLLSRLVNDLQTLSLAEGGQLPLKIESVNIVELLEDVQTSFSGQADQAGVDLRVEVDSASNGLHLAADADRLDQVLSNLVANALRHTPAGGSITLKAATTPEGVRISVQDTGEGIAPEYLPHIFTRFWKSGRSRSRTEGSGSGLGLAISRQLIQAHGGKIHVESEPGRGSIFSIQLPPQ